MAAIAPGVSKSSSSMARTFSKAPSPAPAILQRSRRTPLGLLADVLDARGCSSHLVHEGSRGSLADPKGVALAIVIGSAATADLGPADSLRSELEWLRQADAAGAASSVSDLGP